MSLDAHTSDFDAVDRQLQTQFDRWTRTESMGMWEKLDESLELESIWNKLDESLELESVWNQLEQTIKQEVEPKQSYLHLLLIGVMLWFSFQTNDQAQPFTFGSHLVQSISKSKTTATGEQSSTVFTAKFAPSVKRTTFGISPYRDIAKWSIMPNQSPIATENLPAFVAETALAKDSIVVSEIHLQRLTPQPIEMNSQRSFLLSDSSTRFHAARPKAPNHWKFGFFASANTAHFDFVDFPMIRQNLPHLGSEFGILVSIPIHNTRLNTQFSFTNLKQNENRYINGKFTSITHQINAFNLSSLIEIPIRKHLNWEIGPSFSAPISSVTRRENVIVGVPRYSNLYAGLRTELNWELRSFLNVGIHYNWLEALKKEDINLIRHQVVGLNATFLF